MQGEGNDAFVRLPKKMNESLLRLVVDIALDVRGREQAALDRQRESK